MDKVNEKAYENLINLINEYCDNLKKDETFQEYKRNFGSEQKQ